MMNGSLYEESPPPSGTQPPVTQQSNNSPNSGMTSPSAVTTAVTTTSSASPSSVTSSSTSGPLHIPAKRLAGYGDCPEPSVIRHGHGQSWGGYNSEGAFEAHQLNHHPQYSSTAPTYYNLADRSSRLTDTKPSSLFWSPATSSPTEYKYSATSGQDCHQGFSQTWCQYGYGSGAASRVDHAANYGSSAGGTAHGDDRGRVAAAMAAAAAAESAAFGSHDGYGGLRNYAAPEPVPTTPYPPPGEFPTFLLLFCPFFFFILVTKIASHKLSRKGIVMHGTFQMPNTGY